jgi:ubiquinone/menaquinone biosynthesis C-methylase UbiE
MVALPSYPYVLPQSFDFPASAVVLDVGCGIGKQLVEASGRLKIGVEPDVASAMQSHERGVPVVRAYAEHLPFADDTFDGIICKVVLCLTLEDKAMREIARVVKRDSKCYLAFNGGGYYLRYLLLGSWKDRLYGLRTLINTWWWVMTHQRLPGFIGDTIYQSNRRLRRYFKSNGLQIVSERQKCFLGFPVFIYTEVLKKEGLKPAATRVSPSAGDACPRDQRSTDLLSARGDRVSSAL